MIDPNSISLADLLPVLNQHGEIERVLQLALDEDLADAGDITTLSLRNADESVQGDLISREDGIIAGLALVPTVLQLANCTSTAWNVESADGSPCQEGCVLGRLNGPMTEMFRVERTLLNIVGRLSGVATLTRKFAHAVTGTKAKICDTRKTTPGMRVLEKYAVRCGGGWMHRIGLFDAALYKDNHLAGVRDAELSRFLEDAIDRARTANDLQFVQVEVDRLSQLEGVLGMRPGLVDIVLLDNMDINQLRSAVEMRNRLSPNIQLEASGGVRLETVRAIAETGVDRISVGALTHSAKCLDVGLDIS
ncbi:MAG TPA: carboxylating nicotinate-nucleotide diphosphorylase [Phycisphaerales bacterium]|nr:carboxylating nicotinate-nucleotide diphosphorylase [Phycisphaerales bacterium]